MGTSATRVMPNDLRAVLIRAARQLREARLPGQLAAELERLAEQVSQPCVVAVVGRAKAGKSTFINALLGADLAAVETTETTATINFFRYGQAKPERPVRCYWRDGHYTDETRAWLDGLQGNDEATMRRADGIEHLEYLLLNPFLMRVTLVDTPGTEAAVDEHQERVAEFMGLRGQLRERHERETHRLASEADAVIYLIGPAARATDLAFLEEFKQVTGGEARAVNAVGVLAKIDLNPDIIARRTELAGHIVKQLQGSLNVVVPVSAGLRRALDALLTQDRAGLHQLRAAFSKISPATLNLMLATDMLYLQPDLPDCPIPVAERQALLGTMPWTVFTTIARLTADSTLSDEDVITRLEEIAGFAALRDALERRFLKRGQFLRCYRVVNDARRVLETIRFEHLPNLRKQRRVDEAKLARFEAFLQSASGDPAVARELGEFVRDQLTRDANLEALLDELEFEFARLFHELETYNADYEALQQLEDAASEFTAPELDELRPLLGLYGLETDKRLPPGRMGDDAYLDERQQEWLTISQYARSAIRRDVAERAVTRYGLIMEEEMAQAATEAIGTRP